jgi:hypothetical protein
VNGIARPRALVAASLVIAASTVGGCADIQGAAPGCDDVRRVAVVAQSVPTASFVPCLHGLRAGWSARDFDPRAGRTRFSLVSDRDPDHVVVIDLLPSCDVDGATVTTPRADGTRTYLRLRSITPRYAGTLLDVFAGGCVTYRFDFARGPHIALVEDLESQVGLLARRELALALRRSYDVELGP